MGLFSPCPIHSPMFLKVLFTRVLVSVNNVRQYTDPLCEYCRVALFQHLLQLIISGGTARDLQLPLYPVLATVPVIRLRAVVLRHNLNELARQGRVLCLSYPQISG